MRLIFQMYEGLEAIKYDKNVRTLIIRSAVPGMFCAGKEFYNLHGSDLVINWVMYWSCEYWTTLFKKTHNFLPL